MRRFMIEVNLLTPKGALDDAGAFWGYSGDITMRKGGLQVDIGYHCQAVRQERFDTQGSPHADPSARRIIIMR